MIKLFKTCFKPIFLKPSLLLNALPHYATPIFITEALHLAANVQLLKTTLLWNKWLIYHYLSILWQTFTTRIITNHNHAHISGHMKNDARISITHACSNYALYSGGHTQRTIYGQNNCKKPCNTCRHYLGQRVPGFNSMQLWLKVILGYL